MRNRGGVCREKDGSKVKMGWVVFFFFQEEGGRRDVEEKLKEKRGILGVQLPVAVGL